MSKENTPLVEVHPDGSIGSVEHNPDPRTERGLRRRKRNHPNGIDSAHPAWKDGGLMCKAAPKEKAT